MASTLNVSFRMVSNSTEYFHYFLFDSLTKNILACQKIVQQRLVMSARCPTPTSSRPSTPNSHFYPVSSSVISSNKHNLTAGVSTSNSGLSNNVSSPNHSNHTIIYKVNLIFILFLVRCFYAVPLFVAFSLVVLL